MKARSLTSTSAVYGAVVSVPSDTLSPRTSRKKRTPMGSGEDTLVSFTTVTVVMLVFGKSIVPVGIGSKRMAGPVLSMVTTLVASESVGMPSVTTRATTLNV